MYLLDTNTLLYFLYDSDKLSKRAADIIYSNNERICVSIVSMWEIAIKASIGKLEIKSSISKIAETCEKEQLDIRCSNSWDCPKVCVNLQTDVR